MSGLGFDEEDEITMNSTNQLALYKPVAQPQPQQLPPQPQIIQQDDINQQRQQTIIVKLDTMNFYLKYIVFIEVPFFMISLVLKNLHL